MAEVGKHIKKIRKEKNLTQDELAERLHCTRQTISNYETGKSEPGIEILIELAEVLEVEINDLIYGPKKRENRKRQKSRAVAALAAACVLLVVIKILSPAAKQYGQKRFDMIPLYLLYYVLRPFALTLLGWGIVEAAKAFVGIRIWEGKPQRTVKIVRILYVVSAVILAVFAVLALWTAVDLTHYWWLKERMIRLKKNFDFATIPRLMPWQLESFYLRVMTLIGGAGLFLGAALGFCWIEKEPEEAA